MGLFGQFSPLQLILLILGSAGLVSLTSIIMFAIVEGGRQRLRAGQMEAEARRDMLERGLSADEIAKLLRTSIFGDKSTEDLYERVGPATCDVVVLGPDGDWQHALIVGGSGDIFLAHFIGEEVEKNLWVEREKVRFPASIALDREVSGELPEISRAQPAVVETEGEWCPAYVVMHLERCFVHYIGRGWDENEWVEESRVRFPSVKQASAEKPAMPYLADI